MQWWDVIGWALAVLVAAFVLVCLVAAVVGVAGLRAPKLEESHEEARRRYPSSGQASERNAFISGALWAGKSASKRRPR